MGKSNKTSSAINATPYFSHSPIIVVLSVFRMYEPVGLLGFIITMAFIRFSRSAAKTEESSSSQETTAAQE